MVPDRFLGSVELRPVHLPAGIPFQVIGLAVGEGAPPVRILAVRSQTIPSLADLHALWQTQPAFHSPGFLVAAVHGEQVTILQWNADGMFRTQCFPLARGEEICRNALRSPTLQAGRAAPIDEARAQSPTHVAPFDKSPYASTEAGTLQSQASNAMPSQIGRFRTVRKLGQGGFGTVYLGYDPEKQIEVAIKVLRDPRLDEKQQKRFREEARCAMALRHPNILEVLEVGDENGMQFIVAKFLPGLPLDQALHTGALGLTDSLRVLARVAGALAHAHQQVIVHCDMKPHNIILDPQGEPHIVDFGLAVWDFEQYARKGERVGTPAYMAPEQVRGEVHRIDGRCDIWALGVMLYEVLTHRKPFGGPRREDLYDEILHRDPRPPRQIDPSVSRELERICLKCLSKRMTDRYSSAADLREDLEHHLRGKESDSSVAEALQVVPFRGLRHFEAEDAEEFQNLIPGPRTRLGVPELVRFWKARLESVDPETAFTVGLLYGPSGSGKTSFLQAGVLPRLNSTVQVIHLEATPQTTEARLARALRKVDPTLPRNAALSRQLAQIRARQATLPGRKVLILLDQFEQYLDANEPGRNAELVLALRQCDGVSLQCLLSVRDDFWMGVTRLFATLETELRIGHNAAPLEPMDATHARRVLAAFGRSLRALPEREDDLTTDQMRFLEQAIEMFQREGKIISVHLAIFTQMMQGRPWETATLERFGGSEGLGVEFLEVTFTSSSSDGRCRLHAEAVRNVLGTLLPPPGVTIKSHSRPYAELLAQSGYADQPTQFADLLNLLDREMRLITPVEKDPGDSAGEASKPEGAQQRQYQLTHDYMIPALRRWIRQQQRRTRQGRTQLLLEERTQVWESNRDRRLIPSFWEWLKISLLARPHTKAQQEMMRITHRHHVLRMAILLAVGTLLGWLGLEIEGSYHNQALVERLLSAQTRNVPAIIEEMHSRRSRIDPRLDARLAMATGRDELHLRLARLATDEGQVEPLAEWLLDASPEEVGVIRAALHPYRSQLSSTYWSVLEPAGSRKHRALLAACALAAYEPDDPRWPTVAPGLTSMLTSEDPIFAVSWGQLLTPVKKHLLPSLRELANRYLTDEKALIAASLLGEFTADQPQVLADLIGEAHPRYLRFFANRLSQHPRALEDLVSRLEAVAEDGQPFSRLEVLYRAQANFCMALSILGRRDAISSGCSGSDRQDVRSYLIHGFGQAGLDPTPYIRQFPQERDPHVRQGILLAIGLSDRKQFSNQEQARISQLAQNLARSDPHPGIHSVACWLLKRWELAHLENRPAAAEEKGFPKRRQWYVNSQGQTMAFVQPRGEFLMGGPLNTPRREETDRIQRVVLDRAYAISTTEVTSEQFLRFAREHPGKATRIDPNEPALHISLFDAARYCRWLSEQERIDEKEMCFPPLDQLDRNFRVPENYLDRTGYRLPTEAEWEYACRDGTTSVRPFGQGEALLGSYAWYFVNSNDRVHPVGQKLPNGLGLFDMLGNAYEWCFDELLSYKELGKEPVKDRLVGTEVNEDQLRIIRGGAYHRGPISLRSASRQVTGIADQHRNARIGFRIVRTIRLP